MCSHGFYFKMSCNVFFFKGGMFSIWEKWKSRIEDKRAKKFFLLIIGKNEYFFRDKLRIFWKKKKRMQMYGDIYIYIYFFYRGCIVFLPGRKVSIHFEKIQIFSKNKKHNVMYILVESCNKFYRKCKN